MRRRQFNGLIAAGSGSMLLPGASIAQTRVQRDGPTAVALGFTPDHRRVDLARWPKKADGGDEQRCQTCALFGGSEDGEPGTCSVFGGRLVPPTGWCNAWTED